MTKCSDEGSIEVSSAITFCRGRECSPTDFDLIANTARLANIAFDNERTSGEDSGNSTSMFDPSVMTFSDQHPFMQAIFLSEKDTTTLSSISDGVTLT